MKIQHGNTSRCLRFDNMLYFKKCRIVTHYCRHNIPLVQRCTTQISWRAKKILGLYLRAKMICFYPFIAGSYHENKLKEGNFGLSAGQIQSFRGPYMPALVVSAYLTRVTLAFFIRDKAKAELFFCSFSVNIRFYRFPSPFAGVRF